MITRRPVDVFLKNRRTGAIKILRCVHLMGTKYDEEGYLVYMINRCLNGSYSPTDIWEYNSKDYSVEIN